MVFLFKTKIWDLYLIEVVFYINFDPNLTLVWSCWPPWDSVGRHQTLGWSHGLISCKLCWWSPASHCLLSHLPTESNSEKFDELLKLWCFVFIFDFFKGVQAYIYRRMQNTLSYPRIEWTSWFGMKESCLPSPRSNLFSHGRRCGGLWQPLSLTDEVGWHERCWGGSGSEIHMRW